MPQLWLPWLSASLVSVLMVRWSWLAGKADYRLSTDLAASALIVLAWHTAVWSRLTSGYPDDTILNLSVPGRIGLVVITSVLLLLLMALSQRKTRLLQRVMSAVPGGGVLMLALDLLLSASLFVAGLTIVPQLHYSYYHLLFDLPNQWVIKPPSPASIWHSLSVPRDASLAVHATGLCGWWLLMSVLLSWLRVLQWCRPAWRLVVAGALANIAWHQWA